MFWCDILNIDTVACAFEFAVFAERSVDFDPFDRILILILAKLQIIGWRAFGLDLDDEESGMGTRSINLTLCKSVQIRSDILTIEHRNTLAGSRVFGGSRRCRFDRLSVSAFPQTMVPLQTGMIGHISPRLR